MRGMTWFKAQTIMASARSERDGKPLCNNTRLYRRGNDFAVRLHSTDVVTIHPDDTYSIRTGGWHTPTTSTRIRAYSPASVGSYKGEYCLVVNALHEYRMPDGTVVERYHPDAEYVEIRPGYRVPFYEGIRVNSEGVPVDDHGFTIGKLVKTKGA